LLPTSVLFALAHASNQNVSLLGLVNTFGFGLVLGYAYLRSRDLWLPIAIHFGWNWALAIFGLNVSGFKMGVTGYVVRWRVSDLWSGGAYGPEASVLTCGVIVALLYALHRAPLQPRAASGEV
jgi:membrane protease YdiL (CAAX protease family)